LWSGVGDEDFGELAGDGRAPIESLVRGLAERAVAENAPHSDNTSVAAVRWLGA
jgi:hypothetical protein